MFQIDPISDEIVRLALKSFSELGFTERGRLQEWIAKRRNRLAGSCSSSRRSLAAETRGRLDLFALDKQGNLVVIENRLDEKEACRVKFEKVVKSG